MGAWDKKPPLVPMKLTEVRRMEFNIPGKGSEKEIPIVKKKAKLRDQVEDRPLNSILP